jgi:hypothetical protein
VNAGVQVFLYPEELEHVAPDALAQQVLGLGVDAVSVAVSYHRGRRVFPRHRRISVLTRTTLYIEPDPARYGALRPEGTATPALHRFREACDRAGLRFRAWVVGLHNDSLAEAHPEAAARLHDGSPAGHSLCPSAPAAVEYVSALAADVAAQLEPEAVDLEAAFYPAWEPSYTLTLALDPLTDEEKLNWAQCTCPACLVMPDRAEGVRRLIEAVSAAVHAEGSVLRVFASGPPKQAALQGVSPESIASADALLYGCGPLRGDELQARFDGLRELAGRPGTVSTNWTPERTDLAADVERLAAAGAEGLALYNLSLVPEAGLEAFRAAAAAFKSAVPA